ncbi:MAG: septum formation initiator family protein [Clostridia bacterium]|nr:septum formation initiator family protein [Clostridia bacterium]
MVIKENTKSLLSRHSILDAVIVAFFVFLAVNIIIVLTDISEKKSQISEVRAAITEQTVQNNELKRIIEAGNSDEYIERIARERYGLVLPDERVFINTLGE